MRAGWQSALVVCLSAGAASAEPNVGTTGRSWRPDPPAELESGIGVGGTLFLYVVAAPIAFAVSALAASQSRGRDREAPTFALSYGILIGLETCLVGLVSDDGRGNCPIVVATTLGLVGGAYLAGDLVASDDGGAVGALLASLLAPGFGMAAYNVSIDPKPQPTILVPAGRRLEPSLMVPLLRAEF